MNSTTSAEDTHYQRALASLEHALGRLARCTDQEKQMLADELRQLRLMQRKLTTGRVEIIVFGEISTGKSALINALVGTHVSQVDVRGGWTKDVHEFPWGAAGYQVPGFADSGVVLIDTPGLNEVGGAERSEMAREAAARADLILFVTDSDLNQTEYSALLKLAAGNKPLLLVLNKKDLYSADEIKQLAGALRDRLGDLVPAENLVTTAALPRPVETVVRRGGTERSEWQQRQPDVEALKVRILQVLERDGLDLVALNAAMYAADRTDRIARLRIQLRARRADQTVWSFASFKAIVVALNPGPGVDVLGGSLTDATMVFTLSQIYGLDMNWIHARRLVKSILQSAGWVLAGSYSMEWFSSLFKLATFGWGTALTALPQGAAAGYSSFIVGQASKYYFEHGASWGHEAPKTVIRRILEQTDKDSVLAQLKDEIQRKIRYNLAE